MTATEALLSVVFLTVGCGIKTSGVAGAGGVTADGRPIGGALVTLQPIGGTAGATVTIPVFDGRYAFDPDDGLRAGRYRVRVSLLPDEVRSKIPPPHAETVPPAGWFVDAADDAESRREIRLTADGPNTNDFDVRLIRP